MRRIVAAAVLALTASCGTGHQGTPPATPSGTGQGAAGPAAPSVPGWNAVEHTTYSYSQPINVTLEFKCSLSRDAGGVPQVQISAWNINAQPEQLWQVRLIYQAEHGAETGGSNDYVMVSGSPVVIDAQQKMTFQVSLPVPDNTSTCKVTAFL